MDPLSELIGESPAMVALREQVRRVLLRQSELRRLPPVLILGETGTGKGLLTQALHRAGPRAAGPLVDVNCAAIPETMLEAELFGFEQGAFTDARRAKPGLFQTAHRGALFLDEVGLLPESLQGKLLKAIEDRAVRRLGSTRSEAADAWVIAATSVDLLSAVRERRFREDLYHRLNVLTLVMPPLRQRGTDILLLAGHFLGHACADYGLPERELDSSARAALAGHLWPGNVRELSNLMERVALLSEDTLITAADLDLDASGAVRSAAAADSPLLEDTMARHEREHLQVALQRSGWNITRTAAQLGISRDTLRYRIDKHGLAREDPRARHARARPVAAPAPPAAGAPAREDKQVAEALMRSTRWERRRVALLGAALSASGEAGSGMALGRAIDILVDKAQGFGGQVLGLSPTGLVIGFGLEPVEDAPRAAAHAALAMQRTAAHGRWRDQGPGALGLAVHMEEVLVGQVGSALQLDVASMRQVQGVLDALLAGADGIVVVSNAARPFLERRFLLAAMGNAPPSVGAGPEGGFSRLLGYEPRGHRLTRLAGRREELDLLESRLELARAGQGQVIGIVGEPGIGKSRLLLEFRQRLQGRSVTWAAGDCISFGVATPYLPLIDVARQLLGVTEGDDAESAGAKTRAAAEGLQYDADALPFLVSLVAPGSVPADTGGLSAEAVRVRTYAALGQLVSRASQQQPLVLVVEDLHWIDRTSEVWLASLVEGLQGLPILLLATWRPGHRPLGGERFFPTQLALQPLAPADSLDLVRARLGDAGRSETLVQSILDRAEGNPFFLEELCRAVEEGGSAAGPGPVPGTIEQVLRIRLDRLGKAPRQLLQTAAVLGRTMPLRLLRAIAGDSPDLDVQLAELRRLEFLYERGGGPGPALVFRHALTQEMVYASVPAEQQVALHAAAVGALEALHSGRLDEVLDQLAHHCARARFHDKAAEYLTRFADRAARAYAHAEAAAALEQAMRQVEAGPAEGRERRLLDIVLRRAASLNFLGRFEELRSALLLEQHERVKRLGDAPVSAPYFFWLAHVHGLLGEPGPMLEFGRRSLAEAIRAGDPAMIGCAHGVLAFECFWSGRAREGVEHGRQAVAHLERTAERWWLGYELWVLSINCSQIGDFPGAFEAVERSAEVGRALSDPRLIASAAWGRGGCLALVGEWDEAIAECQRGVAEARDPVTRAIGLGFLGGAYLEKGDAAQGLPLLERAVEQYALHGMRQSHGWFTALLGEACMGQGDLDHARALASEGLRLTEAMQYRFGAGWARRALGRIALAAGELDEAVQRLTEALDAFTAMGARHEVGRTQLDLARAAHRRGDAGEPARHLRSALAMFASLRVPRYVERTGRLAAELGISLDDT